MDPEHTRHATDVDDFWDDDDATADYTPRRTHHSTTPQIGPVCATAPRELDTNWWDDDTQDASWDSADAPPPAPAPIRGVDGRSIGAWSPALEHRPPWFRTRAAAIALTAAEPLHLPARARPASRQPPAPPHHPPPLPHRPRPLPRHRRPPNRPAHPQAVEAGTPRGRAAHHRRPKNPASTSPAPRSASPQSHEHPRKPPPPAAAAAAAGPGSGCSPVPNRGHICHYRKYVRCRLGRCRHLPDAVPTRSTGPRRRRPNLPPDRDQKDELPLWVKAGGALLEPVMPARQIAWLRRSDGGWIAAVEMPVSSANARSRLTMQLWLPADVVSAP